MPDVLDTYTRGDAATPGTTDSGHAYTVLRGSVPIKAGRAHPAPSNSFAVVDTGAGGQDAALSIATGSGGGQALYFRVVDAANYWRAMQRHYSYTYQSGTETYVSHYETVVVGYTATEYEWTATYGGTSSGSGTHHGGSSYWHSHFTRTGWNTSPTSPLGAVPLTEANTESHSHGTGFASHGVPTVSGPSRTGNTRGGQPIYGQQAVYATRPIYSTAYAYEVRLEKCVGGNLTPIVTTGVGSSAPTSLRVTAQGSTIALYSSVSPSTAHGTTSDSAHSTATRHGVGYAETSPLGNSSGIDEFRVQPYNTAPGAPTLLAPVGNEVVDLAQPQTFRLRANDADPGDAITRTDWEWRLVSGGTVQTATQSNAQAQITKPASAFTSGPWQWRGKTYDRAGAPSQWSGWAYFTAGVPPTAPSITSPTNNAVLSDPETPVSWAVENQEAYEVRVLADLDGAPDAAQVLYTSGVVVSTSRNALVPRPVNGRLEHTQVAARYLGLWSQFGSVRNEVAFTPPAVAYLALAVDTSRGYMLATISHPSPSGSQPEVLYAELWRRRVGKVKETLIATNLAAGTVTDSRVQHRTDYEYQVITVGANGSRSSTQWISAAAGGGTGIVVRPARPVMEVPATEVTTTSFRNTWQPVANAVDYVVQRREIAVGEWTTVGIVGETTYLHSGLSAGYGYDVQVIARGVSGVTSDPSTPLRTTTAALPTTRTSVSRSTTWGTRARILTARATRWETGDTGMGGGGTTAGVNRFVIRGGGYVTGVRVGADGTRYCKTDVGGMYRFASAEDYWTQLVTKGGRPDESLMYAVEDIQPAPSNANVLYAATGWGTGRIFRSPDKGQTWPVRSSIELPISGNGAYRTSSRLAVDPSNADHVLYGTRDGKLWRSTDGALTLTQVTGLPVPAGASAAAGYPLVSMVPGTPLVDGRTRHWLVSVPGTGLMRTTDGGASWATVVPKADGHCSDLDRCRDTGTTYAVFTGASPTLLARIDPATPTTFADITPHATGRRWQAVAVHPNAPGEVVVMDEGLYAVDRNDGFGISGDNRMVRTTTGTSAAPVWQSVLPAISNGAKGTEWPTQSDILSWMSVGGTRFSHSGGTLLFAEGMGMWRAPRPAGSAITWEFSSDGIEELVSSDAVKPVGLPWITAHWDRGIMRHPDPTNTNPPAGQAAQLPLTGSFGSAWDLVQSPTDSTYLVAILDNHNTWQTGYEDRQSGYSEDGGATWTRFGSLTAQTHPLDCRYGNAAISAGTGTDRDNIVWVPSEHPSPHVIYWTKDRGATWTAAALPGTGNPHPSHFLKRQSITAHPTTPGRFFVLGNDDANGEPYLWETIDGGVSWTKVAITSSAVMANRVGYWDLRYNCGLSIVAGYLYLWPGHHDGGGNPYWRAPLTNLTTGWTEHSSITIARTPGVGPPLEGQTHPTMLTQAKPNAESVERFYLSSNGTTWTEVLDNPRGLYDFVSCIVADPEVPGHFVIGYSGTGFTDVQLVGSTGGGSATTPVSSSRSTSWAVLGSALPAGTVYFEDFEAGAGGWVPQTSAGSTVLSSARVYQGTTSLEITCLVAGNVPVESPMIPFTGMDGKEIRVTCAINNDEARGGILNATFYSDTAYLGDSSYPWLAPAPDVWVYDPANYSSVGIVPAGTTRLKITRRVDAMVVGEKSWLDNVTIEDLTPRSGSEPLIVDDGAGSGTYRYSTGNADAVWYLENNGSEITRENGVVRQTARDENTTVPGFRMWTKKAVGGPGKNVRLKYRVRATAINNVAGGITEGVKVLLKWVASNHDGALNDPANARGIYPWTNSAGQNQSPGSMQYIPMSANGYQEISKRFWGSNTYKFPVNRSNGTYTIGQWQDLEVTLEWLDNPRAVRITTYKDGVKDLEWTDTGDTSEPGGEPFSWEVFPGLRSDDAWFELDSFSAEPMGGAATSSTYAPVEEWRWEGAEATSPFGFVNVQNGGAASYGPFLVDAPAGADGPRAARFPVDIGTRWSTSSDPSTVRRNEVAGSAPMLSDPAEGSLRAYAGELWLPTGFTAPTVNNTTGTWLYLMQWHGGSGGPPLALGVTTNSAPPRLHLRCEVGGTIDLGPIPTDRPQTIGGVACYNVKWLLDVKHSDSTTNGRVSAWINGVQKATSLARATLKPGNPSSLYPKLGAYGSALKDDQTTPQDPFVVFHGVFRWARSVAAVTV